jgi:hypothetical protein
MSKGAEPWTTFADGTTPDQAFNSKIDCMYALYEPCILPKRPNLELKTRTKQLYGSLSIDFHAPG